MIKNNLHLVYTAFPEWCNNEGNKIFSINFNKKGDLDKFKFLSEKILNKEISTIPVTGQSKSSHFINISEQDIELIKSYTIENPANSKNLVKDFINSMHPDKIHGLNIHRILLNDEDIFKSFISELKQLGCKIKAPYSFNLRREFVKSQDIPQVEGINNFGDNTDNKTYHLIRLNQAAHNKISTELGILTSRSFF